MLSHKEFAMNGSIHLNGSEMTRKMFTKYGAFLEQDDILSDTNTPYELITESAKMRTGLSNNEIKIRAQRLIKQLNLEDSQDRIVGSMFTFSSISAKERKRTALAVELITDPNLIFLDEPTSGLDSENAFTMIKMLKQETKKRKASVICTLHQPSSHLF
jgi:ABC-type multidrug transport system ATPase subunit